MKNKSNTPNTKEISRRNQKKYRENQIEKGLVQKNIWIHPDDWDEVHMFIKDIKKVKYG